MRSGDELGESMVKKGWWNCLEIGMTNKIEEELYLGLLCELSCET